MKIAPILFIDLFCGAGGVSTGADRARILGKYQPVKLIACVNHDPLAIESHKTNHPQALHFNEDIRDVNVVRQLARYTEFMRQKYPDSVVLLWASMECTNYSKAKGGMPRDADSRSLPLEMYNYIDAIKPELFYFENVEEFKAWGPLDKKGKPVSMKKGRDYVKWVDSIKSKGYSFDETILNAADFGAHTKRKRLFGIFSDGTVPIIWPSPTHAENPTSGLFNEFKPWNPVKECLDFTDEGQSIFTRKKPLVEATLKRILAGLNKYVAKGDGIVFRYGKEGWAFNTKYYGNGDNIESIDSPAGTVRTKDGFALVQGTFLDKGFSGEHNHQSINTPAGSIPTKDHYSVVSAFLDKQFSGDKNHESINNPTGSILGNPKQCLVQAKSAYIMNPQYKSKGGSIEKPCFTLIARMDKSAPSLVQSEFGKSIPEYMQIKDSDSSTMRLIKEFCIEYGITDITTRMLRVLELKLIQGFGKRYHLLGNQADQKKFIGNSVPPAFVKAMMEVLANTLYEEKKERLAA